MNDTINLTKDGQSLVGNIICYFENTTNSKKYVYYTLSDEQTDGSPTIKVHVGVVKQNDPAKDTPISGDEWEFLKSVMGNALKSAPNPEVKYLKTNNTLELIDDKAIGMPTAYDYVGKHKAIYDAEATEEIAPESSAFGEPVSEETTAPAPGAETSAPAEAAVTPETPVANEVNSFDVAPETPVAPITPEITPSIAPEVPAAESVQDFMNANMEPTPEDKPVPKVPEQPISEPINSFGNDIKIPGESDISNLDSIQEINEKADQIINDINALREMVIEKIKTSAESVTDNSQPVVPTEPTPAEITPDTSADGEVSITPVSPTPITPEQPNQDAGQDSQAPAGTANAGFETNWFDMPQ